MSCFVMLPDALRAMGEAISTIHNRGVEYCGFDCPQSLRDALAPCRDWHGEVSGKCVYEALFALNVRAVAGRYREESDVAVPDATIFPELMHPVQLVRIGNHWAMSIQPWHYQLLKLLECWLYQTDEDFTINHPLHKGVADLVNSIQGFIVHNAAEYINTPWGSI